jgi:penicillin amidase
MSQGGGHIVKKWVLIICIIVVGGMVVAAGGGYLWFQYTLKKGLPQTAGEAILKGLKEEVEIIRDRCGVPHIYAKNEPDLFLALGYAMAQDRFWQMEFYRRLGQGRLSEVFGEDFIKADRYFRILTAAGVNRSVPAHVAFVLQSFTAGINAYLESSADRLPIEFRLLG